MVGSPIYEHPSRTFMHTVSLAAVLMQVIPVVAMLGPSNRTALLTTMTNVLGVSNRMPQYILDFHDVYIMNTDSWGAGMQIT